MDIDVQPSPGAATVKLLHWLAQDLVVDTSSSSSSGYATSEQAAVVDLPLANATTNLVFYFPPQPPANQTHRYVFLAYAQPAAGLALPAGADFDADVPYSRFPFDLDALVRQTGLGMPVAANWLTVTGS
ncbi:phosphatidylethanolamine-binding protein [Xylariaceae sp. FL1651]|nr:phosphatidylethanolamine-binding protein [Xylariaceae sp. FL1651]